MLMLEWFQTMERCDSRIWVYSTVLKNETATTFFLKNPSLVLQVCT